MEEGKVPKHGELKEELPFLSGDDAEDLIRFARAISAIGNVISALAWNEIRNPGTTALESSGEQIGVIISDYGRSIELLATKNIGAIRDSANMVKFDLRYYQSYYESIRLKNDLSNKTEIQRHLNEISKYIENVAGPAIELCERYKSLFKKIKGN